MKALEWHNYSDKIPVTGHRCRFKVRGSLLEFFGYRASEDFFYVPLYHKLISVIQVTSWAYDENNPLTKKNFPLFYNGYGRDVHEAFHAIAKRRENAKS